MTTIIAVRNVGLYSDSRCTSGVSFSTRKIHKVGKALIGGAGTLADVLKFVQWVKDGGKGKCKIKDTDIIVMNKCGIFLHDGSHPDGFEVFDDVYAIGSGAIAALAAMKHGASPKQALKAAAEFDHMTGGKTQFLPYKR